MGDQTKRIKELTRENEKLKYQLEMCSGKIFSLESEAENFESEVKNLESDVEQLGKEVDELESQLIEFETNSLDDEYKFQFFNEYKHNFTPWELETLLKNGKQFLNENPLHK